jgi:hypothetical protein
MLYKICNLRVSVSLPVASVVAFSSTQIQACRARRSLPSISSSPLYNPFRASSRLIEPIQPCRSRPPLALPPSQSHLLNSACASTFLQPTFSLLICSSAVCFLGAAVAVAVGVALGFFCCAANRLSSAACCFARIFSHVRKNPLLYSQSLLHQPEPALALRGSCRAQESRVAVGRLLGPW